MADGEEQRAVLMTNFEVLQLLREQQETRQREAKARLKSDGDVKRDPRLALRDRFTRKVVECLQATPAGAQTHASIRGMIAAVEETAAEAGAGAFALTRAEKMQVANLAPSTAVEVHLVVECCSERLGDEVAERVADVVKERADPARAAAAEASARESEPEEAEAEPAPKRPRRGQSST